MLVSSGPGDPTRVKEAVDTVKDLIREASNFWHLSWSTDYIPCIWSKDLQNEVWTQGNKSTSKRSENR